MWSAPRRSRSSLPFAALPVAVRWLRTAGPCPVARVEDGATGLAPGSGPTDVVLSAKWRFLEDASRHLALAFTPALTIPTGARSSEQFLRPGQKFWSLDRRFAVVKDWSPRWNTNLAVGYVLVPWFQPQVELNYGHDPARVASDTDLFAVTVGAVAPISDGLGARPRIQQGAAGRKRARPRYRGLAAGIDAGGGMSRRPGTAVTAAAQCRPRESRRCSH